jgi:hypothetical protein
MAAQSASAWNDEGLLSVSPHENELHLPSQQIKWTVEQSEAAVSDGDKLRNVKRSLTLQYRPDTLQKRCQTLKGKRS